MHETSICLLTGIFSMGNRYDTSYFTIEFSIRKGFFHLKQAVMERKNAD